MKRILFLGILLTPLFVRAQCYTVAQTTYVADTTTYSNQIVPAIADDQWSQEIPIGFTFCFYGAQYDSLLVGTNGVVTFTDSLTGDYCPWAIPTAAVPSVVFPRNSIMGVWHDLQILQVPPSRIFCWTSGVAPSRTFTVKFDSVPLYSCSNFTYSGRIILHETTNVIEVQVDYKNSCAWNTNRGVIGIQNEAATLGISPSPYNAMSPGWTASQAAWLFTPTCNICQGVGIAESGTENQILIYPNPSNGIFTLQIQNPNIASYDVIDITGRVVRSAQINSEQQFQFTLENSGMYFVRVYDEANTMLKSERIVVE